MNSRPVLLPLFLVLAVSGSATAQVVTIEFTGRVRLSEIYEFAEEDTVSGSFSYDTAAEGEVWTNEPWGITTTTYTGIPASFRNATGTFSVETERATITITRVSPDSWIYTPRNELRLSFPTADIPNAPTHTDAPFIGFLSFSDSTRTVLADGKLPAILDLNHFQSTRFLFAWNRHPGDEAPLEYAGRLLTTPHTKAPRLSIRRTGEPHAVELRFPSRAGFLYQLEFSDDLRRWHSFGDLIAGGSAQVSRTVSSREAPARLFQIRVIEGELP